MVSGSPISTEKVHYHLFGEEIANNSINYLSEGTSIGAVSFFEMKLKLI